MKPRNLIAVVCALGLLLAVGAPALADEHRPHEGKIVSLDQSAMTMTVQGEKDDQWTLYWTESTKLDGHLTIEELNVGDEVNFDYKEKDGKKWLTKIDRTEKAEKHDD